MQQSDEQWAQIKRNLNGEYHFKVNGVMQEGWNLTLKTKWLYLQMFMFVFVIIATVAVGILKYQGIEDVTQIDQSTEAIMNIALSIIIAPFITAISLFGYHASIGRKGRFSDVFSLLSRSAIICISSLFISVLVGLGLQVFILPGIYLLVATDFALLLIAEKKLRPFAAIGLSVRMVTRYWMPFLKLLLIFLALMVVIIITLGIAIFLVGPLYYNVKGILYRDLFTLADQSVREDNIITGESTFNA